MTNRVQQLRLLVAEVRRMFEQNLFSDAEIVCTDGRLSCNRMLLGLMFPSLSSCADLTEDTVVVLLDSTLVAQVRETCDRLMVHDVACCLDTDSVTQERPDATAGLELDATAELELDAPADDDAAAKVENHPMKKVPAEGSLGCPACGGIFETRRERSQHFLSAHGFKYVCKSCGQCFSVLRHYREHRVVHAHKCRSCSKSFTSAGRRLRHEKKAHGRLEPPPAPTDTFVCHVCGKNVASRQNLAKHMRRHAEARGGPPLSCPECRLTFSRTLHLENHMRTHTGERPHICDVCGQGFALPSGLKSHQRMHTDDKPFKCGHCDMRFRHECNRKSHENTHTRSVRYTCRQCGRQYAQQSSLKAHQRAVHAGQTYDCAGCGEAYKRKYNYRQHIKKCKAAAGPAVQDTNNRDGDFGRALQDFTDAEIPHPVEFVVVEGS